MWSLVSGRSLAYSNGIAAIAPVACHVGTPALRSTLSHADVRKLRPHERSRAVAGERTCRRTGKYRQCLEVVAGRRSFPGHGADVSRSANGGGLLRGYLPGVRIGPGAVRCFALVVSLVLRTHATAGRDDGRSAPAGDDLRAGCGPLVRRRGRGGLYPRISPADDYTGRAGHGRDVQLAVCLKDRGQLVSALRS